MNERGEITTNTKEIETIIMSDVASSVCFLTSKKLKIELPYHPAIALLGIYLKDTDVVKRKAICYKPNVYSSNGHSHQTGKSQDALQQMNG